MKDFIYFKNKNKPSRTLNERFIVIPKNIDNKAELFDFFSKKFEFPFYFGENWDALYDCLTDLSWINEKKITIVHEDIPMKSTEEKKKYIELLLDVLNEFSKNKTLVIAIKFPESCKKEIEILKNM